MPNNIFEIIDKVGQHYSSAASAVLNIMACLPENEKDRLINDMIDYFADSKVPAQLEMTGVQTYTEMPQTEPETRVHGSITGPFIRQWVLNHMHKGVWLNCTEIGRMAGLPPSTTRNWMEALVKEPRFPLEKWVDENSRKKRIYFRRCLDHEAPHRG